MTPHAPDGPPPRGEGPRDDPGHHTSSPTASPIAPPAADESAAPWLRWPVGARVVVRRTVPGGWSDVLGELLRSDEHGVLVRSRTGDVEVPAAQIALGKVVPPAPPRRRPRELR